MTELSVFGEEGYKEKAILLSGKIGADYIEENADDEKLVLKVSEAGLSLCKDKMELRADLCEMLPRLKQSNLEKEMLVKAFKIKGKKNLRIIDATAGFGEDSIILAAAGHEMTMFEYNPIIYELLSDAIERAKEDTRLESIVSRMHLFNKNSVDAMREYAKEEAEYDAILLDPMFPKRQKSASVKKKFQIIHNIEAPCSTEEELLEAALSLKVKKVVVKRPSKGEFLAGKKPDYSVEGKAVRYDVFIK